MRPLYGVGPPSVAPPPQIALPSTHRIQACPGAAGCPSGRPPMHDGMSAMCSPAVLPPGAIWVGTHDRVSPAHSCFSAIGVIFYRWIFRWNLEPRCRCLCLTMY